jgi:hypothetical protein
MCRTSEPDAPGPDAEGSQPPAAGPGTPARWHPRAVSSLWTGLRAVLLARRPGTVVHREQIIGEVWPATGRVTAQRTLDVHIASLRGKLRLPALIETVRGVGYRLTAPAT